MGQSFKIISFRQLTASFFNNFDSRFILKILQIKHSFCLHLEHSNGVNHFKNMKAIS